MRRESRESWPVPALVAEIERLESELHAARALAETDPLTGLANRRAIGRAVEDALTTSPAALLLIDLDRFKQINDTFGHKAGDLVLTVVAGRLTRVLLAGELAARHGGDEFSVLLTDPTATEARAERVHTAITGPITLPDGSAHEVGASVGFAVADTAEELWRIADTAMYQAKAITRLAHENTRFGVAA